MFFIENEDLIKLPYICDSFVQIGGSLTHSDVFSYISMHFEA